MGCTLVVHYWADLQSVHGLRCYDSTHVYNIVALYTANAYSAEREMSASACTLSVAGWICDWNRHGTDTAISVYILFHYIDRLTIFVIEIVIDFSDRANAPSEKF